MKARSDTAHSLKRTLVVSEKGGSLRIRMSRRDFGLRNAAFEKKRFIGWKQLQAPDSEGRFQIKDFKNQSRLTIAHVPLRHAGVQLRLILSR